MIFAIINWEPSILLLYLGIWERWQKKMWSLLSKILVYAGEGHLKNQLKYSMTNTTSGYVLITVRHPGVEYVLLVSLRKTSQLIIATMFAELDSEAFKVSSRSYLVTA